MYTQIFWLQVVFHSWLLLMVKYEAILCHESVDRLFSKWIYEVVRGKFVLKLVQKYIFYERSWMENNDEKSIEKIY